MKIRQKRAHLALAVGALALLIALLLFAERERAFSSLLATEAAAAAAELNAVQPSAEATVALSPASGVYEGPLAVKMTASHPGAAIYFTTDGSLPTAEQGTRYTAPIQLPGDAEGATVVRTRAVLSGGRPGPVRSATYFTGMDTRLPLLSLILDPQDLWGEESGILANPHFYGREWERPGDLFYYDPQLETGVEAPAGVRVHGARSRSYDKKSMRLYFRNEYGRPYLEFPLFPDSQNSRFKRLVLHDGGQDFPAVSFNGTLLRNHLLGNLAREAGSYATYSRPALLFVNGQLWGIYNIRERIDDRYLADRFQIDEADLLSGFESDLQASSGDSAHWDHLLQYVAAHDLAVEEHYAFVQTQVNLDNFIDYALIQIITANADWPHNNQLKFRDRANGRWHWMFWDSDFAFGLMSDSYIEKNMFEHILDHEDELQQQSSLLLRKLLENPSFKTRFLARLSDLLNTVFAPQNVLAQIDQLAAGLEKDITYEIRRWPGPGNWAAGVDYMRDFARQRPAIVRRHAVEAFGLDGTALLTIEEPELKAGQPSGGGGVLVGKGTQEWRGGGPWQGEFFRGVDLQLRAVPDPGFRFAGWDPPHLPQTAHLALALDGDLSLAPRFERDTAAGPTPGSVLFEGYGRGGSGSPTMAADGEWLALQVRAPGGADVRGWRITDNDSLDNSDEGSLRLPDHPALASLPPGTTILLALSETPANDRRFGEDDLSALDGQITLYAGNGLLDTRSDPWFLVGAGETLTLLAPREPALACPELAEGAGPGLPRACREELAEGSLPKGTGAAGSAAAPEVIIDTFLSAATQSGVPAVAPSAVAR